MLQFIVGWTKDSANFNRIHDVMYAFYDCLCEQVRQETHCSSFARGFDTWAEATSPYDTNVDNISLNQWLNMWGRLCRGTAGMSGEEFMDNHCSFYLKIIILALKLVQIDA